MERSNKIFIVISIIALSFVIYVANAQIITNQNQQPGSTQNSGSSSSTGKSADEAAADKSGVEQTQLPIKYIDGTYEGIGTGKNPGIKVSVTINNEKITDITIIGYNDNEEYFNEAASIIPKNIIDAQSTNVVTVSGATLSSNGIIKAVEDALAKAIKQ